MRFYCSIATLAALGASHLAAAAPLDLVRDCGAIYKTSETTTAEDTLHNAEAIASCLQKANDRSVDEFGPAAKTVLLSHEHVVQAVGMSVSGLKDVTLQIDGILEASVHYMSWPVQKKTSDSKELKIKQDLLALLNFEQCTNLTIKGDGVVDGLGYDWWIREWNRENPHGRPHLLHFDRVQTAEITGVEWRNSPRFHMSL